MTISHLAWKRLKDLAKPTGLTVETLNGVRVLHTPKEAKRKELVDDLAYVEKVLQAGAAKARDEAQKTMELARKAVGLR